MDENYFNSYFENIKVIIPEWKAFSFDQLKFTKMPFGNCSNVYIVESPTNKIIYRKFKTHSHGYNPSENKEKENFIFGELSKFSLGPKLFYSDNNFRIEEYLDSNVIKSYEINIPEIRRKLAVKLGFFNSLKSLSNHFEKIGFFESFFNNSEYINNFNERCNCDYYTKEEKEEIEKLKYLGTEDELNFIKSCIKGKELVFSHNDIWCGNILLLKETKDICYIDFEKVGYNFLGYDIGKVLMETVFERYDDRPDYNIREDYFPDRSHMIDFLRFYLVAFNGDKVGLNLENFQYNFEFLEKYEKIIFNSDEEKKKIIDDLLSDAYLGMVVSSLYMSYMGILIGKGLVSMDFIKFGIDNHHLYIKFKELLLAQIKNSY